VERHVSRWAAHGRDRLTFGRFTLALLMALRGSVCIYQGEELGLEEAELAYEDLRDPYGIQFWPDFKGRDGCRTPMVWTSATSNGGFSNVQPWLPVPPAHLLRAVNVENEDPASLLNHYRTFLAFRKKYPAFAKGDIVFEFADDKTLGFTRIFGNEILLCVFNMTESDVVATLPEGAWEALEGHGFATKNEANNIKLPAWGAYFARRA
jgi:alpha-glucosidase